MTLRIERTTKDQLIRWAAQGGITVSVLMERLVAHVEQTADGLPVWLPAPDRAEELPIGDD